MRRKTTGRCGPARAAERAEAHKEGQERPTDRRMVQTREKQIRAAQIGGRGMKIRTIRGIAVLASVGLLVGAFAVGPAEARKKKKKKKPVACAPYAPGENGADQKVTVITDAATADAPV